MATPVLKTYTLPELIAEARAQCPFYKRLYTGAGVAPTLAELPVIEPESYWQAHDHDRSEVLTAPLQGALVINSGGTTGSPKHSYFTAEEWISSATLSALAFAGTSVKAGDRVANLFSAGDLHSSFLLVAESLRTAFPDTLQLPIGSASPPESIIRALVRFNVNVLAGFPTHLLRLIERADQDAAGSSIHIQRILFAGEIFSQDQRLFLERRFPGISIDSVGYASVDAGLIGFADHGCGPGEHRVFDGATLVEIVDEETGLPTEEIGQPGRIVFTSLLRKLMPILRYPTGDLAQWVDPAGTPARRFILLGRSQESARVARSNLSVSDMRALLAPFANDLGITDFQLLVTRENLLDRLTLRIVASAPAEKLAANREPILQKIRDENAKLVKLVEAGVTHPFELEWIDRSQLIVSVRTGKLLMVVDRRAG